MKLRTLLVVSLMLICVGNVKAQEEWHISYNYSKFAPLGLSLGYMPNHVGGYVSGKWGLASSGDATQHYSIDKIVGTSDLVKDDTHRSSYTAGVIIDIIDWLAIYGGAGYGKYGEAWGEENAEESTIVINEFSGPEFEAGLMYMGETWMFGVGGIMMKGTNISRKAMLVDISVQIGLRF